MYYYATGFGTILCQAGKACSLLESPGSFMGRSSCLLKKKSALARARYFHGNDRAFSRAFKRRCFLHHAGAPDENNDLRRKLLSHRAAAHEKMPISLAEMFAGQVIPARLKGWRAMEYTLVESQ